MRQQELLKILKSKGFERFTTFMALVGTSAAYIQAFKIFYLGCATAVSLSATAIGLSSSSCWLLYGISRRIQPLILSNIIGVIGGTLVIIGILYYSQLLGFLSFKFDFLPWNLQTTCKRSLKITTDKHPCYGLAIETLKKQKFLKLTVEHRQMRYLNKIIESDHRRIKRRISPMMGFKSLVSARRVIKGIKAMNMIVKRQACFFKKSIYDQIYFIHRIFHIYTPTLSTI